MATYDVGGEARLVPIEKASEDGWDATKDSDWLTSDLEPSLPPCIFRIQVAFDGATKFKADIERDGGEDTVEFNSASSLTANAVYVFDLLMCSGDTVNFQQDQDVNVLTFTVIEIPIAG